MDSDGLTSRDFPVHWPVLTRWADNDMFGHLNNAVYYQLFDTAINGWIQTNVELDPVTTTAQGIVAESGCRYFSELHFPDRLVVASSGLPKGRSPSRPSDTGCTSTSTKAAADRYRSRTPSGRCCPRRP
jgi:acyl-CoA thioester hydrolase